MPLRTANMLRVLIVALLLGTAAAPMAQAQRFRPAPRPSTTHAESSRTPYGAGYSSTSQDKGSWLHYAYLAVGVLVVVSSIIRFFITVGSWVVGTPETSREPAPNPWADEHTAA